MNNESLYTNIELKKGEYFVLQGQQSYKIGKLSSPGRLSNFCNKLQRGFFLCEYRQRTYKRNPCLFQEAKQTN